MSLRHMVKVLLKTAKEIAFDISAGDYGKSFHLIKCLFKHFFLGTPYNVTIEPSNMCNLHCEFCSSPPWLKDRPNKFMCFDEFKRIVDGLKNDVHYLWLYLAGEPFMAPDIFRMIKYSTDNNLHVSTSTNFLLFNKVRITELFDSKIDRLIISMDGASKESYEKMRKGGNFEKIIENLSLLHAEKTKRKALKPFVEMQMIITRFTEHEVEAFKGLGKKFGADKVTFKTLAFPEWIMPEEQIVYLKKEYTPLEGKKRYDENFNIKRFGLCGFHRKSVILADGSVTMCCYDTKGKYTLDNAIQNDFMKIWNSDSYKKRKELVKARALPLCNKCAEVEDVEM